MSPRLIPIWPRQSCERLNGLDAILENPSEPRRARHLLIRLGGRLKHRQTADLGRYFRARRRDDVLGNLDALLEKGFFAKTHAEGAAATGGVVPLIRRKDAA